MLVFSPEPRACPGLASEASLVSGTSRFKVKTAETFDSRSIIEETVDL